MYGIAISGLYTQGLLVPRITGSDLLTGGAFGAEASLPALVLATALGVALLVIAYRKGNFVAPFWIRRGERDGGAQPTPDQKAAACTHARARGRAPPPPTTHPPPFPPANPPPIATGATPFPLFHT